MALDVTDNKQRQFAITLVKSASQRERDELAAWLEKLLNIRNASLSIPQKIKNAFKATREHKILWPLLKLVFRETKRGLWDERSTKSRYGIVGVSAGILFFGGQSAGLAALGGAIAVPLWIVFGAGATFAGYVLEEISRKKTVQRKDDIITVDYEVID